MNLLNFDVINDINVAGINTSVILNSIKGSYKKGTECHPELVSGSYKRDIECHPELVSGSKRDAETSSA
ncbi:MAG: hypothetical protein IJ689_00850 [Alphaproteobacteria bacterium]|nr:hypothetical protein [Alphaproteobacteria bacterium]